MSVTGYDAIHDNVASIPTVADVVMGYVTGSPDIKWTSADFGRFPHSRIVTIDQGFTGSPVLWATVRDVEVGAWDARAAVLDTAGWDVPRPTIYCNMDTLPDILAAGWKRDLWLAIPSNSAPSEPPIVAEGNVVAIQWRFTGQFDESVVFDPDWPDAAGTRSRIMYPAPATVFETATVSLGWPPVQPIDGIPPTGYTVVFYGLDGHLYWHGVTTTPEITATGLRRGWTYNVHVWANGGNIAPPHYSLIIHT